MQFCPNCGTQLPDKARFCASCGHNLTIIGDHAPKTPNEPQLSTAIEDIEAKKTLALQAPENTPSPTKMQSIEEPKTLMMPPKPKKLSNNGKTKFAEQQRRAASAMGMNPQSWSGNEREQMRPPREQNQQNGSPGAYPRADVYANGAAVMYQGNPQVGNVATRNRGGMPPVTPMPMFPPPTRKRKGLLWRATSPIFTRAQDPEPEKPGKLVPQQTLLGWFPVLALTSALGVFVLATAFNTAIASAPGAELYFWLGLALVFVPVLVRLILPNASRVERISLVCLVTLCFYLTKVMLSPLHFSHFDEFLHWLTVNNIMSTGHLFTKNPLLPVSPFYPGLEIVTNALSSLSGLSTFQAGLIILGLTGILMILSLFLLSELLSGSARVASIAAMVYMTNPHFLTFDSQFAYESLALPLATFVLFAMLRYEMVVKNRFWILLSAWLVLAAMILTHHLTNFLFEGIFLLWGVVYLFLRPLPLRKSIVIPTVTIGLIVTVASIFLIGNTVVRVLRLCLCRYRQPDCAGSEQWRGQFPETLLQYWRPSNPSLGRDARACLRGIAYAIDSIPSPLLLEALSSQFTCMGTRDHDRLLPGVAGSTPDIRWR